MSLFSGAGILDWPFFKDERFSIQYAIDYDAGACQTYRQNIGMHIVHGDVHKAFTKENGFPLDSTVKAPDAIIGGPSCKPFSNANRHTRLEDHPDSDLLMQYMRIVETLNPKVFAIENVPEVLTACGGSYYAAVRKRLRVSAMSWIPVSCRIAKSEAIRRENVPLSSEAASVRQSWHTLRWQGNTGRQEMLSVKWTNPGAITVM